MTKLVCALAAGAALNALAWSSSTAWQWDASGRAGLYGDATSASGQNAASLGAYAYTVTAGAASGVETLEARVFGTITLTGLVLEKYGCMLILR